VQDPQDSTNPIVTWISVDFPRSFTLAEIRAAYGDPSHIAPFAGSAGLPDGNTGSTNYYDLSVVYLDRGFMLETEREFYGPPAIGPGMVLSKSVMFFPPTLAGLTSAHSWQGTDLLPWQGFHDFRFYCAQIQPVADAQQRCPHMDE